MSAPEKTKKRSKKKKLDQFPAELLLGRYEFIRYLGHGSYGHVAEARATSDHPTLQAGTRCAIKKIPNVFDNEVDAKRLLRELRILRCLSGHDTIVSVFDVFTGDGNLTNFTTLVIVFEFSDTDLSKLFVSDQFFTLLHIQYISYQMCLGLKHMHSGNLVHRDIKPSNILVNENCTIKVCDFGLARCITENESTPIPGCSELIRSQTEDLDVQLQRTNFRKSLTRHVVTRWYRAPEVILLHQTREFLAVIDIWAIGCILSELFQMITECQPNPHDRRPLFQGKTCFPLSCNDPWAYNDPSDQLNVIFDILGTPSEEDILQLKNEKAQRYLRSLPKKPQRNLSAMFPNIPDVGIELLECMLRFNPENRITIDETLEHPFFNDVRDVEYEQNLTHQHMDFEDVPLSMQVIRELIIDEILLFNPDFIDSYR